MLDIIDEELFFDAVWELFDVLDERYTRAKCKALLPRLQATFDMVFETKFVIVDRETGNPMNVNAVLTSREAAEQMLRIVGEDKYEVAILLTDR